MTTPHDKALKPCPFCGSTDHMVLPPTCDLDSPYDPNDRAFPIIRCMRCFIDVPGKDFDASGKTAIDHWNRRAPIPEARNGDGWCQPNYGGEIHPRKFMVVYEDAEMGNAVFDDEAEAREHFEKASINWNCYLFGLLPRRPIPAPRGGIEPNWWEEWVKTTRAYNALAKAAQAVIDETDKIHDSDDAPIRYRAPYGAITKLREALASSDRASLVSPPSIRSSDTGREG